MAEILQNSVKAGAGLGFAEYLTGAVSGVMSAVSNKVSSILDASPVVGKLATPLLAVNAIYKGIKETKETNIYNGIATGSLWYGLPGVGLAAAGILSAPLATGAAALGTGMYGVKYAHKAIADSISTIKAGKPVQWMVDKALKAPLKGLGSMLGFKGPRNSGASPTSA